ncbi:MAG: FAD:protein FMN transferase [Bacillota bacterium]
MLKYQYNLDLRMGRMRSISGGLTTILIISLLVSGCFWQKPAPEYTLYSDSMLDSFNTVITLVAYARDQAEFDAYFQLARDRFRELHQLFDIYNNYPGVNNLKTINDMAGRQPVQVDPLIIDLLVLARDWALSGRKTNIALGPVLYLWHQYREEAGFDPANARLPSREELEEAAKHTDISSVIIDRENSTVFLADSRMRLDVGAVAKGYATELVARELEAAGLKSGAINSGGNIRTIGKPLDGKRERWGIGIFDPDSFLFAEDRDLDMVYINDASVVSSGDYQRYYYVDGKRYHHLIDPDTLMPATQYRAITVVTRDSGYADLLSTELFLLPYEESRELADSLDGVEALWVMPDGEVRFTRGLKDILRSQGATP